MSDIFETDDPEFFGRMPVRTELTVLGPDDPNTRPLGFTMRVYDGTQVARDPEMKEYITTREALKVGDEIYVSTLFGICKAKVYLDEDGTLFGSVGEHTVVDLVFRDDPKKDDRAPVWVSRYAINTRGLKRTELTTT